MYIIYQFLIYGCTGGTRVGRRITQFFPGGNMMFVQHTFSGKLVHPVHGPYF